jgi:hypothetical protein
MDKNPNINVNSESDTNNRGRECANLDLSLFDDCLTILVANIAGKFLLRIQLLVVIPTKVSNRPKKIKKKANQN